MRDPRDGNIAWFEKPVLGVLMACTVFCVGARELLRRLDRR